MSESQSAITLETLSVPAGKPDAALWRVFTAAELVDPQFGLAWLDNLSAHALDEGDRPLIIVARRSAEDLAALPVVIKPPRRGVRDARSLSTFYSSLFKPLVQSDDPLPLLTAIFAHLAKTERCSHLTLMPLDLDSEEADQLLQAQQLAGWRGAHSYFCFGNWLHDVNGQGYAQYYAALPSKLRNTIRRKQQKFGDGTPGSLSLTTGAESLESSIAQYNTVYANSWKMQEPYPEFIPALVRLAASRGWLRLGIASYNSIPVAAQIWLVHNGVAYIYKLAYDDNYRELSPGTVLTAFMFEQVIDGDEVHRIDYLSGDDVYKRDWMTDRRERHGTAAYNPRTIRGLLALALHTVKRLVRRRRGRG